MVRVEGLVCKVHFSFERALIIVKAGNGYILLYKLVELRH